MSEWWSSDSMDCGEESVVGGSPPPSTVITSIPTAVVYPSSHHPVIRTVQPLHRLSSQGGSQGGIPIPSPFSSFHHKTSMSAFLPVAQRGLHVDTVFASTPGDVVPVLLSPVLSRPVRSLSAQYAFARQAAVSDSEPELCCTIGQRRPRISRPSDSSSSLQTPPRCVSPAIAHSPLSSRFSACNAGSILHSSGNGSLQLGSLTRAILQRSDSDSCENRRRYSSACKIGRQQSGMYSQTSVESSCSGQNSASSLVRMQNSSLGHSDPQISASSTLQLSPYGTNTSSSVRLRVSIIPKD